MGADWLARELKRGTAEVLILSLLEEHERHGYDLARLIGERSEGAIHVSRRVALSDAVPSRGPESHRGEMGREGGQRRRRYYRLTAAGKRSLARQRNTWEQFVAGLRNVAGIRPARKASRWDRRQVQDS
jgi:DNA-binding PadR family transcriptional regulator